MKTITKYVASDGKEFDLKERCRKYEDMIERVNQILSKIRRRPEDVNFLNGRGYIQHDIATLSEIKENILKEIVRYTGDNSLMGKNPSFINRILGDSGYPFLSETWFRFMCIDDFGREWGQMYFCLHPEKGEPVAL